jgi:hypothetical protein
VNLPFPQKIALHFHEFEPSWAQQTSRPSQGLVDPQLKDFDDL